MAEPLLIGLVGRVAGKAADALVKHVARVWRVDKKREMLERQLLAVQKLLVDSDHKRDRAVQRWTKDLRAAAYEAEGVLDDFQYEALRRQARNNQPTVRRLLGCVYIRHKSPLFRLKASWKLKKVLDKINDLVKEMNKFGQSRDILTSDRCGASLPVQVQQDMDRQTHSALDEPAEIIGRDKDKAAVIKRLSLDQRDERNVQVLPIVGMGGLGKTTLAKMLYNDQEVQSHFPLKLWLSVSEAGFDRCSILKSILELVMLEFATVKELATISTCSSLPDTIEQLLKRLQKLIGRKRYLLILDDVWNEDQQKWDGLKQLLASIGGPGSRIVVTSRSQQVASIMGTLPTYELACLDDADSWTLFSKKAFNNGVQKQAELDTAGKCIVKKCGGLPLALKTMGGLMSSTQHVHEWDDIAQSNLGATESGQVGILSILKLSYMQLPSEMKQCFAFCAVLPKDYEIEKDMLIQLWIANDFIQEENTMGLEEKGETIFKYLVWRSFLQDAKILKASRNLHVPKHELDGCKMHALMHDLAKHVFNECATAKELIQKTIPIEEVRHLNISGTEGMGQLGQMKVSKGTRINTVLMPQKAYHNLKELNVVSTRALCCRCDDPSVVHNRFSYTAHLRYLDLSWSDITTLPSSICNLYNLMSLRLNNCHRLLYLPEGMTSLTKLRHLYLLECENLGQMPPKISILKDLCTLTTFVVDTQDGCGIDELKDMRQLGNRLELYNLRKVQSEPKANLHEKRNLHELSLCWDRKKGVIPKQVNILNEELVLKSLSPHKNLKVLEMDGYSGQKIPEWMADPDMFQCLRELVISNCRMCNDLPVVWLSSSSSLEYLSLSNVYYLTTLCKKVDTSVPIFPKLRRMKLFDLPRLKGWAENSKGEPNNSVTFPQLQELIIYKCCKLAPLLESPCLTHPQLEGSDPSRMPLDSCPSLVSLKIGLLANVVVPQERQQSKRILDSLQSPEPNCNDGFNMISIINLSKLNHEWNLFVEELVISSSSKIDRWPFEELRRFPSLRSLRISRCKSLGREGSSPEETLPVPQLERLLIESCDSLKEIPRLPPSLEELDISRCKSLGSLPSNLPDLAKLRELCLSSCDRLAALPEGRDGLTLTSLEALTIKECPRIREFPPGLQQRIPSLKSLTIWDCPDLQRHCRQGGRYFELVSSIRQRSIPAIQPMKATDGLYMLHAAGVPMYCWRF